MTRPGERGPRPLIGTRRQSRERALTLLYEAELKGVAPGEVLGALPAPADEFATTIVLGVGAQTARIDGFLSEAAVGWEVDRMPVVDRIVLRMATWELLERPDTSSAVIIDEAVEIAKRYCGEEAPPFVNGVLDTLARRLRA